MYWAEFFTIAIAHLFAVASPGPDFAVVIRQNVRGGTRSGVWTSLGVGCAILLHVSYCLLGVALLLSQSPALGKNAAGARTLGSRVIFFGLLNKRLKPEGHIFFPRTIHCRH